MLDALRVLELADGWGAHCGRILADLGADVVKVEPPSGDPLRAVPPFAAEVAGPDRSLWWIALNANKRGVVLDLEQEDGRAALRRLAERADVVVESLAPSTLVALGLGYDALRERNPGLILVSITPYGREGPLADAPASDLEVTAASGALWLAGEPGRAPVRTTLPQSAFWAGMYGAMGALFALHARAATGRGQQVDVSAQASMVTVHPPASVWWDVAGESHGREGSYLVGRSVVGTRYRNIWRCADGHVSFAVQGGPAGRHTGRMLAEWMQSKGVSADAVLAIDWERFDNRTASPEDVRRLEDAIAPFFQSVTRAEFLAAVQEKGMLGYPVQTPHEVYTDQQLAARGFWQDVDGLRFPGGFALFDGERPRIRRPAPRLGEHTAEVLAQAERAAAEV